MSQITVQCSNCGKRYGAAAHRAGHTLDCLNCGGPIHIPTRDTGRVPKRPAMSDVLRRCIDSFGSPPRRLSLWDRQTYFNLPRPPWLGRDSDDKLQILFKQQRTVFEEGIVVWGHVVQANRLMFSPGSDNCPGELVYSVEDWAQTEPYFLGALAQRLYNLKETHPPQIRLAIIADYLTDERIRVFGLPVPSTLSPHIRCRISTTFFVRKHLPGGVLSTTLLPIVVNPKKPFVALPLPVRYWPPELLP